MMESKKVSKLSKLFWCCFSTASTATESRAVLNSEFVTPLQTKTSISSVYRGVNQRRRHTEQHAIGLFGANEEFGGFRVTHLAALIQSRDQVSHKGATVPIVGECGAIVKTNNNM